MLRTGDVLVCVTVISRQPATNPVNSRYSISVCGGWGRGEEEMLRLRVMGGRDSRPVLQFASWEALGKLHRTVKY